MLCGSPISAQTYQNLNVARAKPSHIARNLARKIALIRRSATASIVLRAETFGDRPAGHLRL